MNDMTTSPDTVQDERAVRDVVAQAQDLQNDPTGLPALHTPDTVIVNIAGRRLIGRDAFLQAMSAALESPLRHVRTTVEVIGITFPAADIALVSCVKTVHDERPDATTSLPSTGALTYVMRRADGEWRIALAQTTPIA